MNKTVKRQKDTRIKNGREMMGGRERGKSRTEWREAEEHSFF